MSTTFRTFLIGLWIMTSVWGSVSFACTQQEAYEFFDRNLLQPTGCEFIEISELTHSSNLRVRGSYYTIIFQCNGSVLNRKVFVNERTGACQIGF